MADKSRIEAQLGIHLYDFAYPFGTKRHYNIRVQKYIQSVGYTHMYSSESSFAGEDVLDIPRTLIEEPQALVRLRQWILGGYDVFCMLKI